MMTATEWYHDVRNAPSDIVDHLGTFVALVDELDATAVIELGVRSGNSTAAWLYALEGRGHLWSVDITHPSRWVGVFPHWSFILGDDLSPSVLDRLPDGGVDVVFIDTSHEYEHTLAELTEYTPRVRKGGRVVLHDTEVRSPDGIGDAVPYPVRTAIEHYTEACGLSWENHEHCHGLGIITIE